MYHIILAGGSGSRFWPESRQNNPKQLLKIVNNKSMIRQTYNRVNSLANEDKIFIVASRHLSHLIHQEIPEIPKENFIIEPSPKNTAPAIGLAAVHIFKKDPNAIMAIYPADHLIIGNKKFTENIIKAKEAIQKKSTLITIGIKPTFPSTGYGYIQYDPNEKQILNEIYKVKTFAEKPELDTATSFIKSGEFLWNSGIFVWKAEIILLAMKTFMCELHDSLNPIYDSIDTPNYNIVLDREWELIKSESIDYGILEKAKNVYTIKADFQWNDMGSWNSLFEHLLKNDKKSCNQGDVITIDSENNLIISPNKLTAVLGINNLTIINLDDATLIVPHERSEEVKDLVKMLKSLNKKEYL